MNIRTSIFTRRLSASPWLTMWSQPRATFRRVTDDDRPRVLLLMAAGLGTELVLTRAGAGSIGDHFPLGTVLVFSLLIGALAGPVIYYGLAALLAWTGRWIGGRGRAPQVWKALLWGGVPSLWGLLLWLLAVLCFGAETFTSTMPVTESSRALTVLLLVLIVARLVVIGWSIVVHVICLAEAHGFSVWRAVANFALAGAVLLPFWVLAYLVFR